ncbi:follicle cell protein 3C-1 [Orussus abietinus]|uniref:follicle cell protein 3C-1 n=1 Tax=Orussus abietinus TaxID=222816 RepID=UPI00062587AC|nr:follicle cell protein 3C-1 [Orussus abietinus]
MGFSVLFSLFLWSSVPLVINAEERGTCSCAAFSSETDTEPIIEQELRLNVECNQKGSEQCQHLCIALAESAKEKVPCLICEKINKHVENMKVALFSKSCGSPSWKFTGIKSSDMICCHEGEVAVCNASMLTNEE